MSTPHSGTGRHSERSGHGTVRAQPPREAPMGAAEGWVYGLGPGLRRKLLLLRLRHVRRVLQERRRRGCNPLDRAAAEVLRPTLSLFWGMVLENLCDLRSFDLHVERNTFCVGGQGQTTQTCAICQEVYGSSPTTQLWTAAACGHHFCQSCMRQDMQIRQRNACALCRQAVYKRSSSVSLRSLLEYARTIGVAGRLFESRPFMSRRNRRQRRRATAQRDAETRRPALALCDLQRGRNKGK